MTPKVLKPVLVMVALLLSAGPLRAQEPKAAPQEPKPASKEAQALPAGAKPTAKPAKPEAKDAAGKAKAPAKKPVPPPRPPNYMVGEEPAPGQPMPRPPRPKLVDKKKKEKIPYNQRLNLNAATREELKKLPGVTDEYAAKILAGRPYSSKTELVLKKVIPTTVYFLIKDQVAAGPVAAKP